MRSATPILYEITVPDFGILILRSRTMKPRNRLLKQTFADDRFTNLETDLVQFESQYQTASNAKR